MPRVKKIVPVRESALFETLKKKGVRIPLFTTEARGIGEIGVPALVTWHSRAVRGKEAALRRAIIARYSDVVPVLMQALTAPCLMIQQYVAGHEVACGVIEYNGRSVPFVPVDVIPREQNESMSWHASEDQIEKIQSAARRAHEAVRGGERSCVRCVIDHKSQVYVTAVDCTPPLNKTSLFTQSARAAGFSFAELKKEISYD